MKPSGSAEFFKPDRLLAFSDGVFGVAITLLVIDVHLSPISADNEDPALLQALWAMGPKLLVFAFTFIILGMSWLGHHRKFSYIDKVDGILAWKGTSLHADTTPAAGLQRRRRLTVGRQRLPLSRE